MIEKVDFKNSLDSYQATPGGFRIVTVPDMQYLMVDGHGDPNTAPAYTEALSALYPVAYKLKFLSKRELDRDYVVPPLEGLWWAQDMDAFAASRDKSRWDWTMMLMVPEWIDRAPFLSAVEQAGVKNAPARLDDVRLKPSQRGVACKRSTTARSMTKVLCWSECTTSSSPRTGCAWTANTTRSISATFAKSPPTSCAPYFASRSGSPLQPDARRPISFVGSQSRPRRVLADVRAAHRSRTAAPDRGIWNSSSECRKPEFQQRRSVGRAGLEPATQGL